MLYRLRHPVGLFAAMLIVGSLAVPTLAAGSSSDPGKRPGQAAPAGHAAAARTCDEATRIAAFAEKRVKKVRKRWRNGQVSTAKYNNAVRIWRSWVRERNRLCSAPPPPAPALALTASEVANRVFSQANVYCNEDAFCYAYGNFDTSTCASKSTYTWSCYGYNLETYGDECDFREVVSRSGYNGLVSNRDLTYGGSDGFNCF